MMSPLDMPTRRPVTQTQSATVRYSTSTATAARDRAVAAAAPVTQTQWDGCPGSNGELSSSSCFFIFGDRCSCW